MQDRIFQGFKRVFGSVSSTAGYSSVSEEQWMKMADAISDVAMDIVTEIQSDAMVAPGIPTSDGSSTVAPGVIL